MESVMYKILKRGEVGESRSKSDKFKLSIYIASSIIIILCQNSAVVVGQNSLDIKNSPLRISQHALSLKVGDNDTIWISPTNGFNTTFENETIATLTFQYSKENIISTLQNITLVTERGNEFKNTTIQIIALNAGRVILTTVVEPQKLKLENIFLRISVHKLAVLVILCEIVGWVYFAAWSISFYPQIYQNYRRKSVRGLSLDFVFLNITGFSVYGIFNVGLFWIKGIQQEYLIQYPTGIIPVQLNDVVFTLHAIFACSVTLTQCLIYDRGSQTVTKAGKTVLFGIFSFLFVMFIVTCSSAISWLTFLSTCSYIKLFITLIKYIPQGYLNWSRKSTSGWSIGNVLLDFTGGVFSILQMFILAFNHNDWTSIFGDFTKFGLGLFSIIFDVFFIIQHYVLYRNHAAYEPIEGATNPIINPHEDMITSNHIQQSSDVETSSSLPSPADNE